jgi:hypothetical protein
MSELNPYPESCCGRRLPKGHSCLSGFDNGRYYACRYAYDRRRVPSWDYWSLSREEEIEVVTSRSKAELLVWFRKDARARKGRAEETAEEFCLTVAKMLIRHYLPEDLSARGLTIKNGALLTWAGPIDLAQPVQGRKP